MLISNRKNESVEKLGGSGLGTGKIEHWLQGADMPPNTELMATLDMAPGVTIGDHAHHGEMEVYYIVKGQGDYNDNGKTVKVGPGDVTLCYDGESHGMVVTGDENMVMHAIIVKG